MQADQLCCDNCCDNRGRVETDPRVLWVGIGYGRGTSRPLIETAIRVLCRSYNLAEGAIAGIATLETKVRDNPLIALCHDRQWQLRGFPASELRTVTVPHPSAIVERATGTPSVSEAAALLAALTASRELRSERLTVLLSVPKQVFRQEGQSGAVTVAIAQYQMI